MRLLNAQTKKLHTFYTERPPYAILSHTWLDDDGAEVTYDKIQEPEACTNLPGWPKIDFTCQQAIQDGYEWVWIDTCCIQKSSSAELSEAINSMFNWYMNSSVCYAYLSDIDVSRGDTKDQLIGSRWWSRSWTLQEFLIPRQVVFYDTHWTPLGTKNDHERNIARSTGIGVDILRSPQKVFEVSVAKRMSWAAKREAKREEDLAYALLGIFAINMPLLYGEGPKAFHRLQIEILRTSGDQSVLAWNFFDSMILDPAASDSGLAFIPPTRPGMFAHHPNQFQESRTIDFHHNQATEIRYFNFSLKLSMPIIRHGLFGRYIGLLPCSDIRHPQYLLGIPLEGQGNTLRRQWIRSSEVPQWGTGMVHVRDALDFEEHEVIIEALDIPQPSPALNYSILLEYSNVSWSNLALLDAPPYIWNVDDTKTALTTTRRTRADDNDRNDRIVIAWLDHRHNQILCATMVLSDVERLRKPDMVELYTKPALSFSNMHQELPDVPDSEASWVNKGFKNIGGMNPPYQAALSVKRIFNNVIITLKIGNGNIGNWKFTRS